MPLLWSDAVKFVGFDLVKSDPQVWLCHKDLGK